MDQGLVIDQTFEGLQKEMGKIWQQHDVSAIKLEGLYRN